MVEADAISTRASRVLDQTKSAPRVSSREVILTEYIESQYTSSREVELWMPVSMANPPLAIEDAADATRPGDSVPAHPFLTQEVSRPLPRC